MGFVIGLIVGLVVGAAIVHFLGAKKASTQAAALQDLKRQLDLAESEHERRLREATTRLQQDYDAQLKAAQAKVAQTQIQAAPGDPVQPAHPTATPANSLVSSPPPDSQPTAPLPQSAAAPSEPDVAAPPVTATAPAPTPQPSTCRPNIQTEVLGRQVLGKATAISAATDPNALLADSYASDATVRENTAQAIAEILPAAGAKEQARWFPVLGRLARDPDATVRLSAVRALSNVKSSKRLPLLRRALRDTEPAVVEVANGIISQAKGRSRPQPATKKRRLPKNK